MLITQKNDTVDREYPYCKGVTLIIARSNNHDYRAKVSRLLKQAKRHTKDINSLTLEQDDKLICSAMAGTVLVGWQGMPGNIPFDEATATDLLINDIDVREFVSAVSSDMADFIAEEKAALVKKSPTPTTGA